MITSTESPNITKFENTSCELGKPCVMTCEAGGTPTPLVIISRNGQLSRLGVEQFSKFTMRIENVSKEDNDVYVCTATSEAGVASEKAVLDVEFGPYDPLKYDQKVWLCPDRHLWRDKFYNVTCVVEANPAPSFQWYITSFDKFYDKDITITMPPFHENYEILYERRGYLTISTVKLRITASKYINFIGTYTCEAKNKYSTLKQNMTTYLLRYTNLPTVKLLKSYAGELVLSVERSKDKTHKLTSESSIFIFYKNEYGFDNIKVYRYPAEIETAPEPLVLISQKESALPDQYIIIWDDPVHVGLPIFQYRLKYRRASVNNENQFVEPLEEWTSEMFTHEELLSQQADVLEEFWSIYAVNETEEITTTAAPLPLPALSILDKRPFKLPSRQDLLELLWRHHMLPEPEEVDVARYEAKEIASHRVPKTPYNQSVDIPVAGQEQVYEEETHYMYKLRGLKPDTWYQVEIICQNELGSSPANEPFVFKTDFPDANAIEISERFESPKDFFDLSRPLEAASEKTMIETATSSSTHIVIPITIIFIFILFFFIVDLTCYFTRGCSITMTICKHVFGKQPLKRKSSPLVDESKSVNAVKGESQRPDEDSLLVVRTDLKQDVSFNNDTFAPTSNKLHETVWLKITIKIITKILFPHLPLGEFLSVIIR
ncbi:hypothetical protein HELRODRAFT_191789 [Helobdella robusta]|uniref:Ig-like domain-containing protein n=1 Tax=Helobdella robusta TaxID=6412 RepID=T1FTB8_HELRO|nr:hypothetical protein HELRODRAFT_191789 [Helobdella robusta]ESO03871.1 hypothetical protein HELRODRAFT_191789 [Helobdella robusta]